MASRKFEKADHASLYAEFRPNPPQEIIDKTIEYLGEKLDPPYQHVLDVGCGSGQSTHIWRPYFQKVTGSDVSPAQIEQARKLNKFDNVDFMVCPSEKIPLSDNCVELISVVEALHWFNKEEFFREAKRLLVKNGVLSVQGYGRKTKLVFDTEEKTSLANTLMNQFFYDKLEDFWPPNIEELVNEYSTINFPFSNTTRYSGIITTAEAPVDKIIGFHKTYSPYQEFKQASPEEAEPCMKQLEERLLELAGGKDAIVKTERNHFMVICRNE